MGGFLSSRWGAHGRRLTVEEAYLSLQAKDLAALAVGWCGRIDWTGPERARGASVRFAIAQGDGHDRRVQLSWDPPDAGQPPGQRHASLGLQPRNLTYGTAWWLRCPTCDYRRAALYLATPAAVWQCRVCAGLAYHSQRLSLYDLVTHRATVLASRLGAVWHPYERPPRRPKGMRRRTYSQRVERLTAIERERDRLGLITGSRLLGWIGAESARRLRRRRRDRRVNEALPTLQS